MQNEFEPVANRNEAGFVQYVCQLCGGYRTLIGASDKFLPFIDHLIAVVRWPGNKRDGMQAPAALSFWHLEFWHWMPGKEVTAWLCDPACPAR
jgi:hypothetical protein